MDATTGDRAVGEGVVEDRTAVVDGVEVRRCVPTAGDEDRAPVVLLHEGLGSVGLWRDVPPRLARATQRPVVAWSRPGHGRSAPPDGPRRPDYLHRLAADVPRVLREVLGVGRVALVGHSDGATIALLHAATATSAEVEAVVAIAPHVVVEEAALTGIRRAAAAHAQGTLAERLAAHHDDAASLFDAWHGIWTAPEFRDWDITDDIATVAQPLLLVQARDDGYATLRQLDLIEAAVAAPTSRVVLSGGGHSPHLTRTEDVLAAIARHLASTRERAGAD